MSTRSRRSIRISGHQDQSANFELRRRCRIRAPDSRTRRSIPALRSTLSSLSLSHPSRMSLSRLPATLLLTLACAILAGLVAVAASWLLPAGRLPAGDGPVFAH